LGYQHRGIEAQMIQKQNLQQRATLAESIAGDTVVGHTTAFSMIWESLCYCTTTPELEYARHVALELERMAIHTGDMAAICADMAYQLGNSVLGRLRTPLVNFMQEWMGCRLSKGLIRPGENRFPFTQQLSERLLSIFDDYERDFTEITDQLFTLPSTLSRMERTGAFTNANAIQTGVVGTTARSSGLCRDIRFSHPTNLYRNIAHKPIVLHQGDVHARTDIRRQEIYQSMNYIRHWIANWPLPQKIEQLTTPNKNLFALSMIEGWRGEICHCAITNEKGELMHYKIKDPSFHNWMALAVAVRNNDISDFPLCNKSFNLSYAGHDL
jgi:Ni,Fe-hydrogenase III large subunit